MTLVEKYNLSHLSEDELNALKRELNSKDTMDLYAQHNKAISEHKEFLGKCYYDEENDKYLRVISARSTNELNLECLTFKFPVKLEEKRVERMMFSAECAFGKMELSGIKTENIPFFTYNFRADKLSIYKKNLKEITVEEYYDKMGKWIEELVKKTESVIEEHKKEEIK